MPFSGARRNFSEGMNLMKLLLNPSCMRPDLTDPSRELFIPLIMKLQAEALKMLRTDIGGMQMDMDEIPEGQKWRKCSSAVPFQRKRVQRPVISIEPPDLALHVSYRLCNSSVDAVVRCNVRLNALHRGLPCALR